MRRTYFVSDEDVFTLGSRKYAPAESGVAEMCNMYCHRAGRRSPSLLEILHDSMTLIAHDMRNRVPN